MLAVAYKHWDSAKNAYSKTDEQEMTLKGYIAFLDPSKPTAKIAIETLRGLGIDFKVLTGDNDLITKKICGDVGLDVKEMLTGEQVEKSSDDELRETVKSVTVFFAAVAIPERTHHQHPAEERPHGGLSGRRYKRRARAQSGRRGYFRR